MRLNRGLLDDVEKKDPVKLDNLLGNAWEGVSEFFTGLLDVDPELQARRDADAKELYDLRAESPFFQFFGWGDGNDERSDTDWIANFPKNVGAMYRDTATMATNPAPTTEALSSLAAGGALNLTPLGDMLGENVGVEQRAMANEFGEMVSTTFGSWEEFEKAVIRNPADALSILVGGGVALNSTRKVAGPLLSKGVENLELQTSRMMDKVIDFGQTVDDMYRQNMGMTRLIGYQGNSVGAIFRELDMNKAGSNMGTHVEGHGQYISGQRSTGRFFAKMDADMLENFERIMKLETDPFIREIYDRAASGYMPATIRDDMMATLKDPVKMDKLNKTLNDIEFEYDNASSQLYEIELDAKAVSTFINREGTKKQQTKAVQAEYKRLGLGNDATGSQLYSTIRNQMIDELKTRPGISILEMTREAEKLASEYLSAQGIKGMHFQDRVATKGINMTPDEIKNAGSDLRNYLIYDTSISKVLKRQDIDIDVNTPAKEGTLLPIITDPLDPRFSSRVTEKRALEEGTFDEGGTILVGDNRIIVPNIDLRQLEGYPFIASYADLSRAGGYLTHVNGTKFPNPVKQAGGQDFMFIPENIDRNILWASKDTAITGLIRQAAEMKHITGKDPLYLPFRMSPTGLDFSHQTVDTILQSAIAGLTRKQKDLLDKKIRTESVDSETGKAVNTKWQGIDSENPLKGTTGAERKEISRIIDVNFRANSGIYTKGQDNGVISWTKARVANTDRNQLNKQEGTIYNIGQTRINEGILLGKDKSGHLSYDTAMPGVGLGRTAHDIHITDLLDMTATGGQRAGQKITREGLLPNETRQINTSDIKGIITHGLLMDMEKRGIFD